MGRKRGPKRERAACKSRGVFGFVTMEELRRWGYTRSIYMQCVFDTKFTQIHGCFHTVQARSVLRGDMMIKDLLSLPVLN